MQAREEREDPVEVAGDTAAIASDLERIFALFPRLLERVTQVAGTLSGGEQQMLAIGRAPRIRRRAGSRRR